MEAFLSGSFWALVLIPGGLGYMIWALVKFHNPKDNTFLASAWEIRKNSREIVIALIFHVLLCMSMYNEYLGHLSAFMPSFMESWKLNLNPFTAAMSGVCSPSLSFNVIPIIESRIARYRRKEEGDPGPEQKGGGQ